MHISASQINSFLTCRRIWGWRYLDRLASGDSAATALGSECHSHVEHYGKEGVLPNIDSVWTYGEKDYYPGKIAVELIQGLNSIFLIDELRYYNAEFELKFTVTPKEVKRYYNIDLPGDINLVGIFDVFWIYDGVNIVDHKTSSDPAKWGKKEEHLKEDPQRILYEFCAPIVAKSRGSSCRFWLNYASTKYKRSGSYIVKHEADYDQIRKDFVEQLLPVIKEMARLKRARAKALDLPPEPHACDMFLGCERKSVCNLTNAERIVGLMSSNMSILEKIKAAKEKQAGAPMPQSVNPPEEKEEAPQVPETAKAEADELEKSKKSPGRPKGSTKKAPRTVAQQAKKDTADDTGTDSALDSDVSAALGFLAGCAMTTPADQTLVKRAIDKINEALAK
jgi:hypothetical protein